MALSYRTVLFIFARYFFIAFLLLYIFIDFFRAKICKPLREMYLQLIDSVL